MVTTIEGLRHVISGLPEDTDVWFAVGHYLCEGCSKDIVRCDSCNAFLGINRDVITDNFGKSKYPELSLPEEQTSLIFCNRKCLQEFLNKKPVS